MAGRVGPGLVEVPGLEGLPGLVVEGVTVISTDPVDRSPLLFSASKKIVTGPT